MALQRGWVVGRPPVQIAGRYSRVRFFPPLLAGLLLAGCATLQSPEALRACAAADVATTVVGVRSGLFLEANPLWKASVNAGHFAPFVLATVALVWAIERWASPEVSGAAAGVECGLAARNLFLMR